MQQSTDFSHTHLIVGSAYSGSVPGELGAELSSGITDDGGIALTLADGTTVIDAVGMNAGSAYKEGTTLTPLTSNLNRGYERKPGGISGSCYDTENNASDFSLISPSDPQNLSSPVTVCAGAATPMFTPTATFLRGYTNGDKYLNKDEPLLKTKSARHPKRWRATTWLL